MAKRDILKEAIADAKAVKETAIANAKAALEEAFTPQLKSMLAAKLEEMELDEELSDPDMRKKDDKGVEGGKEEEKTLNMEPGNDPEELDEEINLDEILAEIELDEDARTDAEEEGYEDGMEDEKEDMEDKEDEEIDLEDMTDEDLKSFIEDVIADMVGSGELEAGENFEEEDVDVEDEVDVEVDSEEEVEISESQEEDIEELNVTPGGGSGGSTRSIPNPVTQAIAKAGGDAASWTRDKLAAFKKWSEDFEKNTKYAQSGNKMKTRPGKGFLGLEEEKEEELKEAYSTIETLKSELNEVNLLNAKLLYTNKIFKAKTLTESQKVKVLGAFDKAGTVKETKLVFETLNEGLKSKKSPIRESLGAASRVSGNVNTKKPIIETDPMVARFQKLAGLK